MRRLLVERCGAPFMADMVVIEPVLNGPLPSKDGELHGGSRDNNNDKWASSLFNILFSFYRILVLMVYTVLSPSKHSRIWRDNKRENPPFATILAGLLVKTGFFVGNKAGYFLAGVIERACREGKFGVNIGHDGGKLVQLLDHVDQIFAFLDVHEVLDKYGMALKSNHLAAQNTAQGLITFYNTMYREQGISLPQHLVPVCHALMDERIKKLMIICGPGLGKSMLISTAYPAHRLGVKPSERTIGISAAEDLMQGFLKATYRLIETDTYRALFPGTRVEDFAVQKGLVVTGHPPGSPDASYSVYGTESSALTGKHGTLLILDDIHNRVNSNTFEQCDKVVRTYYDTILGRADPGGCRFIIAGRRWHLNDIYAELAKGGEYVVMTLPAERPGTSKLWYDVFVPDGLECVFTEPKA